MVLRSICLCLLCSLWPTQAFSREVVDLNLEINSVKKGAEAKQDALDQAVEQATRKLTEELLGGEKTEQSWARISPKLLKTSPRYVLFTKAAAVSDTPEGSRVTVQMRLAPDVLEGLLREMGLFAGGTVRLLPLIAVSESRGSKYYWWADGGESGGSLAQDYFKRLFQQVASQFRGKSVYVLDPSIASFRMSVPAAYRLENLRREDEALLGQYLKADVVLSGRVDVVRVRPDAPEQRIDYNLQLWQAKNGRSVMELVRSEAVASDAPKLVATLMGQSDKKVFAEMAAKLGEAIGAGNLNLGVVRVTVTGALNYRQQSEFRRRLGEVREIRAVKERLFEPSRVTYEVETQASGTELAKAVQRTSFAGFSVSVDGAQDNGLALAVRATSAQ